MKPARGFILVNALVLVTALAAVAALLLSRASTGRALQHAAMRTVQLEAYLDGFEAFALALIDDDRGPADHPGEAWARADYDVPLDRGRVAGRLVDLQAGFNINLLANGGDPEALAAFARLTDRLGVAPETAAGIIEALSSGGPERPLRIGGVETRLPGGALHLVEQLPISGRDLKRLAPYLVALPGDALINVNTAPGQVLAAFLPEAGPSDLSELLQARRRAPYSSVEAFTEALTRVLGPEAVDSLRERPRFSVGSDWFAVEMAAELEGRQARRRSVLHRRTLPDGARVAYRLDRW